MAGIQSSLLPSPVVAVAKDSTGKHNKAPDNSRSAPGKVIKAPAAGSVSDRWKWAEQNGGSGSYWIGYVVGGDETGRSKYYASEMPVRIDGGVKLTGRMSLGDGDLRGFVFYGVPLTPA